MMPTVSTDGSRGCRYGNRQSHQLPKVGIMTTLGFKCLDPVSTPIELPHVCLQRK